MDSTAGLIQKYVLPHESPNIPPFCLLPNFSNISEPSIKFATEVFDISKNNQSYIREIFSYEFQLLTPYILKCKAYNNIICVEPETNTAGEKLLWKQSVLVETYIRE
jgi:hypothetical protein